MPQRDDGRRGGNRGLDEICCIETFRLWPEPAAPTGHRHVRSLRCSRRTYGEVAAPFLTLSRCGASLRLDVGRPDHLAPLLGSAVQSLPEVLRNLRFQECSIILSAARFDRADPESARATPPSRARSPCCSSRASSCVRCRAPQLREGGPASSLLPPA